MVRAPYLADDLYEQISFGLEDQARRHFNNALIRRAYIRGTLVVSDTAKTTIIQPRRRLRDTFSNPHPPQFYDTALNHSK